jgi:hypothetical protein
MDWWMNCINLHQGMFVHFNLFSVPGYFCLCGYILQDYVKSSQNRTLTKKLWNQLKHNGIVNNFIQAHQSLKRSLQVGDNYYFGPKSNTVMTEKTQYYGTTGGSRHPTTRI